MNFPTHKKYQVIYADPPWRYNTSMNVQGSCTTHYNTMTNDELSDLPVSQIADNTCALFMWATNPKLPDAIALMKAWGFEYKTVFKVWRKTNNDGTPVLCPGWWSRSSVELLLVGTKGYPLKKWKTTCSEPQEFASVREAHSKKPDAIRDAVEHFLNVQHRVEIFARMIVPGWDSWGNEIAGYFYEGCGQTPYELSDTSRSIGVQCDLLKKKPGAKGCGGIKNHKTDCGCFVCKKIRNKIDKTSLLCT